MALEDVAVPMIISQTSENNNNKVGDFSVHPQG